MEQKTLTRQAHAELERLVNEQVEQLRLSCIGEDGVLGLLPKGNRDMLKLLLDALKYLNEVADEPTPEDEGTADADTVKKIEDQYR